MRTAFLLDMPRSSKAKLARCKKTAQSRKAIDSSQDKFQKIRARAFALLTAEKYDKAQDAFGMLLALGDEAPQVRLGLAACSSAAGDREQARDHLMSGLAVCQRLGDRQFYRDALAWGEEMIGISLQDPFDAARAA